MRVSFRLLFVLAFAFPTCQASTSYVVTNNDNVLGNSITIYALDSATGMLVHRQDVATGGFGEGGGYFATVGASAVIAGTGGCLFAYDTGSSDIAAFTVDLNTLNVERVGNYNNPSVIAQFPGGSLAVTPNGAFLYATYARTENIGAWSINADCSLTFIAAYPPTGDGILYSSIKVTPSGQQLLVSVPNYGFINLYSIDQSTGTLTALQGASFWELSECRRDNCFPAGIDITRDGKVAIFGNYGQPTPSVLALAIEPMRLKNPVYFVLPDSAGLSGNATVPFLSNGGYNGAGPIYISISGTGKGSQPGVVTGKFQETGTLTVTAATPINSANQYDGLLAAAGRFLIVSEWFNALQVFIINSDGTITPTSQGPVVNSKANGAYSFFIYPDTR